MCDLSGPRACILGRQHLEKLSFGYQLGVPYAPGVVCLGFEYSGIRLVAHEMLMVWSGLPNL